MFMGAYEKSEVACFCCMESGWKWLKMDLLVTGEITIYLGWCLEDHPS